jgi:hypothetical protein
MLRNQYCYWSLKSAVWKDEVSSGKFHTGNWSQPALENLEGSTIFSERVLCNRLAAPESRGGFANLKIPPPSFPPFPQHQGLWPYMTTLYIMPRHPACTKSPENLFRERILGCRDWIEWEVTNNCMKFFYLCIPTSLKALVSNCKLLFPWSGVNIVFECFLQGDYYGIQSVLSFSFGDDGLVV